MSACSNQFVGPKFERFEFNKTPSPSDYPDAPGIVILDRGVLHFTYEPEKKVPIARLRRYRRIKILQSSTSLGTITLPYDPGTIISDVIAHSIHPDGTQYQLSGEIQDVQHPSGVKAKQFAIPGAVKGAVIEFAYDHYFDDLRFLPPWFFQSNLPTKRSEFAVMLPVGYDINYRFYEFGEVKNQNPERFEIDQYTRLFWYANNQKPFYQEQRSATRQLLSSQVRLNFIEANLGEQKFVGFRDWDEVQRWFKKISGDWTRLDPEQINEANKIVENSSDIEKALKLFTIIARDLKRVPGPPLPLYLTWIPSANTTINDKMGNETSRGLALAALLKAVGLDVNLGLVAYNDRSQLYPDFPDAQALDGVVAVLNIGGVRYFLDPTQLTADADVPSKRLQGSRIVLLKENHSEIIKIPRSSPDSSETRVKYRLKIDRQGQLKGSLEATLFGNEAGLLRRALFDVSPDEYTPTINAFINTRGGQIPMENCLVTDLRDLRRPLRLSGEIRTDITWPSARETSFFFEVGKLLGTEKGVMKEVRRHAFRFGVPRRADVRMTLSLPTDHSLTIDSNELRERWAHGNTELTIRKETKSRLGLRRIETISSPEVSVKDYRRLLRYLKAQENMKQAGISVERPALRGVNY